MNRTREEVKEALLQAMAEIGTDAMPTYKQLIALKHYEIIAAMRDSNIGLKELSVEMGIPLCKKTAKIAAQEVIEHSPECIEMAKMFPDYPCAKCSSECVIDANGEVTQCTKLCNVYRAWFSRIWEDECADYRKMSRKWKISQLVSEIG